MKDLSKLAAVLVSVFWLGIPSQAPAQERVRGDLAQLQGKWTGFVEYPRGKIRMLMDFKGKLLYSNEGDGSTPQTVYSVSIDESKSPKQIFLTEGRSTDTRPDSPLAKIKLPDMKGIYELKGDTLIICASLGDQVPRRFARSTGVSLTEYKRGDLKMPEGEMAGRKGRPGGSAKAARKSLVLENATVSKIARTTATLSSSDGQQFPVVTNKMKDAFDVRGEKAYDHTHFFHQGDVVSVTLVDVGRGTTPNWQVSEARMVTPASRTEAKPKAAQDLQRATVGKAEKDHIIIYINNAEVLLYANQPYADAYDAAGTQLPRRSANKLLREGNVVDVGFKKKEPTHPYYTLSEIHLVQGQAQ